MEPSDAEDLANIVESVAGDGDKAICRVARSDFHQGLITSVHSTQSSVQFLRPDTCVMPCPVEFPTGDCVADSTGELRFSVMSCPSGAMNCLSGIAR